MSVELRERALRLLARREHSRAELARKLAAHAESLEQLAALLDDLSQRQLLSDERYVEMRLHGRTARFGNARLANELRTQGIAAELVATALAQTELDRPELERAREVWQRKFGARPIAADAARETAKQMRFLLGRGFSAETIRHLMRAATEND